MDYDLAGVLDRLKEADGEETKREVYMETLFDWADAYMENLSAKGDVEEAIRARQTISQLWLHYATMEREYGTPDLVADVYLQATEDPAAGLVAETYIEAALYFLKRNVDEHDMKESSSYFMRGLKKEGMPADEIEKLKAAKDQILQAGVGAGSQGGTDDDLFTPTGGGDYDKMKAKATADHFLAEMMKIHQSSVGDDEDEVGESTDGFTPEMLVKRFYKKPPFLFESDSLITGDYSRSLDSADSSLLESYLGVSLSSEDAVFTAKCEGILDILESLWVMQAIKENQYSKWFAELHQIQIKELKMKEAAVGPAGAEGAEDRTRARNRAAVQKEVLAAIVNKGIWNLVQEEHRILIRVGFPGFSIAVLDDLESHLSGDASAGTSKSAMSETLEQCLRRQRAFVATVLSRRKGKVPHLDGTLPVAAKVDPRLARKRRLVSVNSSSDPSSSTTTTATATATTTTSSTSSTTAQQKKGADHGSVLEQSKPTTLAGKAKVLPAPDPATLTKLAEAEANPRKTRAKRARK